MALASHDNHTQIRDVLSWFCQTQPKSAWDENLWRFYQNWGIFWIVSDHDCEVQVCFSKSNVGGVLGDLWEHEMESGYFNSIIINMQLDRMICIALTWLVEENAKPVNLKMKDGHCVPASN